MSTNSEAQPKLDPPGAGIPFHQRMALRYLVKPLYAARTPADESERRFHKISERIFRELAGLSSAQLEKKTLVDPITGLEDSSRYWSIAMTLDHLVIVGTQVCYVIEELSSHRKPQGKANTANVKPQGELPTDECIRQFRNFSEVLVPGLRARLQDFDARGTFAHPWFGPMTAKEWFWLLPTHQRLHLRQIRAIKAKMGLSNTGA